MKRFDVAQQRKPWLGIPIAVVRKFGDDQAGSLAALIAYYAFFSIFPLVLVFVTVLGFVLHGDHSAQQSVADSAVGKFPVIGDQIKGNHLSGSVVALIIGVVTSLAAGLGVTQAASQAMDRVWAVPMRERPNFVKAKLRGVTLLALLGALFVVGSGLSGIATRGLGGPVLAVFGIIVTLGLNFLLFLISYNLLTTAEPSWRSLMPGAAVAAVLWAILQSLGTVYIHHIQDSSDTYGTFALVIGILGWLHLGAQMTIYCAEVNVVLDRHLWPRSLFGPPIAPADAQTLTALAKVEERHETERIDVKFERPDKIDGFASEPAKAPRDDEP